MSTKVFTKYFRKLKFNFKYRNMLEATSISFFLLKFIGYQVRGLISTSKSTVEAKLSYFGLCMYIFWYSLYIYCVYIAFDKDQKILWLIFNTRLKQYGEIYEKTATILYVVYMMWKLPFQLHNDPRFAEKVFEVDHTLAKLGVKIDYDKHVIATVTVAVIQQCVCYFRIITIWLILYNLELAIPFEKIYQGVFPDALAMAFTTIYCYYLLILKERYNHVNLILINIKNHKDSEHRVFIRRKSWQSQQTIEVQDIYVCEKIKLCAKANSLMFAASEIINNQFGFALFITMLIYMNYVILYLFYFMEATASSLFLDMHRYLYFLLYVFWQISYAVVTFMLDVYFADSTVSEAKLTSFFVHEIINDDLGPLITKEAMQLSVQLLHQTPKFTAFDLYTLDYSLLQEGARSVLTFLVILLQFVTDPQGYI